MTPNELLHLELDCVVRDDRAAQLELMADDCISVATRADLLG